MRRLSEASNENEKKDDAARARRAERRLMAVALVACALGVVVSGELTHIHVSTHTDPDFHSACAVSEGVNCETVALSRYSVFAGVPVSVWGLAAYVVMGGLAAWRLLRRRPSSPWPLGVLVGLFGASAAVSVLLATIAVTRIDSVCLYCSASYLLNFTLLVLGVLAVRKRRDSWPRMLGADLRTAVAHPAASALLVAAGAGAVAALVAWYPPYWRPPTWEGELCGLDCGEDETGHWTGARRPQVSIVEFSDYECPHCRRAHERIRRFVADHADRVRLYHRHLPLDRACNPALRREFHKNACLFARAAECAAEQRSFWEMNDALFNLEDKDAADETAVEGLAVRLGLDRSEFKECMSSGRPHEQVASDLAEGNRRGLRGTPTFFVGEERYLGRIPDEELENLVMEDGDDERAVRL